MDYLILAFYAKGTDCMIFSKERLKGLSLSFIFPWLGLFYACKSKNRILRLWHILIPLFLSLLAFITIPQPTDDLVGHYDTFNSFSVRQYTDLFTIETKDLTLPTVIFIIKSVGMVKNWLPMVFVFMTFYLAFKSLRKVLLESKELYQIYHLVIFYIIVLLAFDVRAAILGLRFPLAASFLMYGIVMLKENFLTSVLAFLAAVATHFSMILFCPLLLVGHLLTGQRYYPFVILISYLLLLFPVFFENLEELFFLNLFVANYEGVVKTYTDPSFQYTLNDDSIRGLIFYKLPLILYVPVSILMFFSLSRSILPGLRLIMASVICVNVTSFNNLIQLRFLTLWVIFTAFFLVRNWFHIRFSIRTSLVIMFFSLGFSSLFVFRKTILNSYYLVPVMPTFTYFLNPDVVNESK